VKVSQTKKGLPLKKIVHCLAAVAVLLAIAAPAYADDGNKDGKGDSAPEAPIALMLPLAGAAAVGARAMFQKKKHIK